MTMRPSPPRLGRLLLRLRRLGSRREEIEADLLEQFERRVGERGGRHAARRYVRDVLSVRRLPRDLTPAGARPWKADPSPFGGLWRDVVFAMRLFRRRPAFVGLTVAGLGLAIGVSTAGFGLISAAAFRPAGISDPDSVVSVTGYGPDGRRRTWTYEEFTWLRDRTATATLEAMLYAGADGVHVVSGGYLATFGARPVLGRLLGPADEDPAAPLAVVVSEGFWKRRLQSDPAAVGRTITLGDVPVTVIGVTSREFRGPVNARMTPALWITATSARSLYPSAITGAAWSLHGRLRTGVDVAAAEAELSALAAALNAQRAGTPGAGEARVRLDPADTVWLVRGRTYTEAEAAIGAPVALVTEQFARTVWPAGDPVGARLDDVGEELAGVRVIGVVSDSVGALVPRIRQDGVFVPLTDPRAGTLMVRTRGPAEAAVPLVHAAAAALDPRVRIVTVAMKTAVADEMRPVHAVVTIASMISTVALGLALAGLYGVTAFVVSQRTQEVGIRMALGARARDVAGLLARESLRPVAIGLATGLGLAILAGKLFMSLIFGVSSTDPASLAAAAGALALSAFAAVAVPARRAARVDPAAVLRQL